jgi:Response regulator containing CheY-like receiver, AAA-type ATPase, and DNA-binding domains
MSTPRVFVLDDDLGVCRVVNRMLSLEKYEVRTSQSVEAAVNAIEEKRFDAYVLDHRLPDGSGLDIAERLRAKGSGAPIILISGYDLEGVASRAKALHVFDVIQKPFSREALCNALKKSIESAPTVNPSDGGEVNASLGKPQKKRSRNAIQIGSIIFLLIVLGVIIYLFMARH